MAAYTLLPRQLCSTSTNTADETSGRIARVFLHSNTAQKPLLCSRAHFIHRTASCSRAVAGSKSRVVTCAAEAPVVAESAQPAADSTSGASTVPKADTWELDFCSRPILDDRGKKLWELIICDPARNFQYSKYFPNNKINSTQLKLALSEILGQEGAQKPRQCKFFRAQMLTIISTALSDLEIKPLPSRRCFALYSWLEERVPLYEAQEGYDPKASTLFSLELDAPQELPDALRGEQWRFVQLPLKELMAEVQALPEGNSFGARFDVDTITKGALTPDTPIPGVCVFTRRALPMAAWTNGYELAALKADTDRACVILETGVNQRWRYGSYRRSPETTAEARAWEQAKQGVEGLHFLAIQEGEESDIAGLWLLADRAPPKI